MVSCKYGRVIVKGGRAEVMADLKVIMAVAAEWLGEDVGELGCKITNDVMKIEREEMRRVSQ